MSNQDIQSRAGKFLQRLGKSPSAHAEVHVPDSVLPHNPPTRQRLNASRFVGALSVALPAMAMISSASAQEKQTDGQHDALPAKLSMSVNGEPSALAMHTGALAHDGAGKSVEQLLVERVYACMEDQLPQDLRELSKDYLPQAAAMGLSHLLAQDKSVGIDVKVAAFCQNPRNWQAELNSWKGAAERATAALAPERKEAAIAHILDRFAQDATKTFAKHTHSLQGAVELTATHQQAQTQSQEDRVVAPSIVPANGLGAHNNTVDPSLIHRTSGDWLRAITSIAEGAARLAGSREAERDVREVSRDARQVERIGDRIAGLGDKSGARKWEEIGRIMSQSSRIDIGEYVERANNRGPRQRN